MRLYAGLSDRLLEIRNERRAHCAQSSSIEVVESLTDVQIECVGASPERPDRVFVGTVDSGLKRSRDGGEHWETVTTVADRMTAVTVSPHDPDEIWLGTEPSGVYRSTDGGFTWNEKTGLTTLPSADRWSFPPRPHTHHVRWIEVDPTDPELLYVAIEAGAFLRTTDGGETWEDHPDGARRDTHTIATHPDAPGRVYAAAGDGYAESKDYAESWETHHDGLDHRYVWGLAVDSVDPDTLLVSSARGALSAHSPDTAEAYLYRRSNGSWERAMDGLPEPDGTVRAALTAGQQSGTFLALTNRGLFRTLDAGGSWTKLTDTWDSSVVSRDLVLVE